MISNKQKYIAHCKTEPSIPIFSKDWWLDATCGIENWDVALVEKGGKVIAFMPYYMKKRYGMRIITMPPLTKRMGPWIKLPQVKYVNERLSFEKKVMTELIDQLPLYDYFSQHWNYNYCNWLPFYWKGFQQTTRYTYVIEDLTDIDNVFSQFSSAKRKNIKKASSKVEVRFDLSARDFYENHKMTLAKQDSVISYSFTLFSELYERCYKNDSGRTIYAVDSDGNLHSALFVIWDSVGAYDLISTIDPDFRNSGSATLLVYEMIKYVSKKTKRFDFEGSMFESVERSFRQFGAIQRPFFNIKKTPSRLIRIGLNIIDCAKAILNK